MYYITPAILITFFLYNFLIRFQWYYILREYLSTYKQKFTTVKTIVGNKNTVYVLWVCIWMLAKAFYIGMWQYLNKSVVRLNNNTYEVTYILNGKTYKLKVKIKKGPNKIIQALDHNDIDMTDSLHSFYGPHQNFHGTLFTPKDFNVKRISVNTSDGDEKVFEENDHINI